MSAEVRPNRTWANLDLKDGRELESCCVTTSIPELNVAVVASETSPMEGFSLSRNSFNEEEFLTTEVAR